jgi:enamine deaminase RidA (YjgF/YER057c/UK114 family)
MRHLKVAIALVALVCGGVALGADRKIISPPGAKPIANYSQGILAYGTLCISGQGGEDVAGKIPSDFDSEVRQSLENIGAVLKGAGMLPADVVSVQLYLKEGRKVPTNECRVHKLFQRSASHQDNSGGRRVGGAGKH